MKLSLHLVFLLVIFNSCSKKNCEDIKIGKFTDDAREAVIIRTKNKQIEVVELAGLKLEYDLQWLGNCEMLMILVKDDSRTHLPGLAIGDSIHVQFLDVNKNSYQCESSYKNKIRRETFYILNN